MLPGTPSAIVGTRLAPTTALLAAAPDADVVVVAHRGLEGLSTVREILTNVPLRQPVQVKLWRHPGNTVPRDRQGGVDWLYDRWEEVDSWVDPPGSRRPE